MANDQSDQSLEAEGIPEMYDAPPGRDIETNEEALMAPRDYPIAAGEDSTYAVTAAEGRAQEPIADRAAREEPDFGQSAVGEEDPLAGHLFAPDSGVDTPDVTSEEVGVMSEDGGADLSPEEAAVHVASEDVADDVDPAQEAADYLEGR